MEMKSSWVCSSSVITAMPSSCSASSMGHDKAAFFVVLQRCVDNSSM